jgi:hypothetical protein
MKLPTASGWGIKNVINDYMFYSQVSLYFFLDKSYFYFYIVLYLDNFTI